MLGLVRKPEIALTISRFMVQNFSQNMIQRTIINARTWRIQHCHWNDNLAVKDILCFQSRSGQIMVLSPKLKPSKDV